MSPEDPTSPDDRMPRRSDPDFSMDPSPSGPSPKRIGPYRILGILGEGGMGVVYLAEQQKPVRRKVALKVIKLGMDTKEVIARFESERQALALMNHPNIAQVFEAGATEAGRPYFAMEHVQGEPITDYCDRHRLSTKERLELMVHVCRAIHHAHQKAVIHRDIKPSNVLVMVQDENAVPKVIDFGVAKAIDHKLTERTVFTEQGQLIGTPAYMSPEQAEMTGLNVDTTTDVYSLGVLLYELLVGVQPFDAKSLREAGLREMHRVIREVDPPKPSTRISTLADDAPTVALKRHTEPAMLQRQVRGELDWITMRAMEKDRTKRYASASELAADLERHLHDEPVVARPRSAAYQLRKMVARHRVAVAFAGTVFALLVGFGLWMGVLYGRAREAEQAAVAEAERVKHVSGFLVELYAAFDPREGLGPTLTAPQILGRGEERIEKELADQPDVQAVLMATIGNVYRSLGLYENADPLLKKALKMQRDILGPEHPEVARSLDYLGQLRRDTGDYDAAENRFREALVMRRKIYGEKHPEVAESLHHLGRALEGKGDYDGAEAHYETALAMRRELLGNEHPDVAQNLNDLATALAKNGSFERAEAVAREALAMTRKLLGEEHLDVSQRLNDLGFVLWYKGEHEETEQVFREALAMYRKLLGEEHPSVAISLGNLAMILSEKGDHEGAEEFQRESLAMDRKLLGEEHPDVARNMTNLAHMLENQDDYEEAETLYREALAMYRRLLGEEHPEVARTMSNLGNALTKMGEPELAEPLLQDALALGRKVLPEGHRGIAFTERHLGDCLAALQRFDEAERLLLSSYRRFREDQGRKSAQTRKALERVVSLYEAWGKPDQAAEYRARLQG